MIYKCRVGLIGGAWVIGIIDELKLCDRDGMHRPQLIDTKTRNKPTPPSPPQKQNGRCWIAYYSCDIGCLAVYGCLHSHASLGIF